MQIISHYFPDINDAQIQQFNGLETLFQSWNQRINVISRKDVEHLAIHHILHSLAIARIIRFQEGTQVLDVGTGGGLPGIPLAILFPKVHFHLVDSIAKKIKVTENIAKELGLENVTAEQARVEKLNKKFPYIVSRAVTNFPDFINLIKKRLDVSTQIHNHGLYYLKGGDFQNEIESFRSKIKVFHISDFFKEEFFDTKKVIYYNPAINPA